MYWNNIFDGQQLTTFIHIVEDIVVAMVNETKYMKDLKLKISDEYITTKCTTTISQLNEVIGRTFIEDEKETNTHINAYILRNQFEKQVIGGWGDLYLEENENGIIKEVCKESIPNPFGEGKLYKTGYTGKFLPDGSINILENDCRYIMTDINNYTNINNIEKTLNEYEGIDKATTEYKFDKNKFKLISHIYGKQEPDMTLLNEYLKTKLDPKLIPTEIIFHS